MHMNRPKLPPRESGTICPIEKPFDMFDYLRDLTKFTKFHRASPGAPRGGQAKYPGRFLSFLILLSLLSLAFFSNSSTARRELVGANFSRSKGAIPLVNVPLSGFHAMKFCHRKRLLFNFRCQRNDQDTENPIVNKKRI